MGGLENGMRAWVAEAKKEAGPDEFLRNSSDSASYFLCSFSLEHLDESGWDENNHLFKLQTDSTGYKQKSLILRHFQKRLDPINHYKKEK